MNQLILDALHTDPARSAIGPPPKGSVSTQQAGPLGIRREPGSCRESLNKAESPPAVRGVCI